MSCGIKSLEKNQSEGGKECQVIRGTLLHIGKPYAEVTCEQTYLKDLKEGGYLGEDCSM